MSGRQLSAPQGNKRFVARRRRRRRRVLIAFCIIFFLLCAGIVYELRQSAVRISHVQVFGPPALPTGQAGGEAGTDQSLAGIARRAMHGYYLGIIPRDSIFFFPASRIRAGIVAEYPDIAAVSIFRNGLTSISVKANARVPVARWCGLAPTIGVEEYCYVFDASGFIFAATATSTQTLNPFALYAPLEGDLLEPLRATLAHAERLPSAFDFARQVSMFGSSVTQVIIRGDEVDDRLESGTRITYVLGDEQNAFTALVSSREHLNLADGSIDYVDLRFAGETYVKRKK